MPTSLRCRPGSYPNTVEIIVTGCIEATSGSLSPCGRGPGRGGGQGPIASFAAEAKPDHPSPYPLPARGEGDMKDWLSRIGLRLFQRY